MTKRPCNPSHPPRPASKEPRGSRADKAGAPGDSFYSRALGSDTRKKLIEAHKIKSLDWEMALLRVRLRKLLVQEQTSVDPNDKDTKAQKRKCETRILKAIELLIRAYSAKIRASGDSTDPDGKAIENILREAADTVGLERIPWPSNC